jgi:hypothetical protein
MSQPGMEYSNRLRDDASEENRLEELFNEALGAGLDVSRLTERWQLVHILVEQQRCDVEGTVKYVPDPDRFTIFALPGEVRNAIYGYILVRAYLS